MSKWDVGDSGVRWTDGTSMWGRVAGRGEDEDLECEGRSIRALTHPGTITGFARSQNEGVSRMREWQRSGVPLLTSRTGGDRPRATLDSGFVEGAEAAAAAVASGTGEGRRAKAKRGKARYRVCKMLGQGSPIRWWLGRVCERAGEELVLVLCDGRGGREDWGFARGQCVDQGKQGGT